MRHFVGMIEAALANRNSCSGKEFAKAVSHMPKKNNIVIHTCGVCGDKGPQSELHFARRGEELVCEPCRKVYFGETA